MSGVNRMNKWVLRINTKPDGEQKQEDDVEKMSIDELMAVTKTKSERLRELQGQVDVLENELPKLREKYRDDVKEILKGDIKKYYRKAKSHHSAAKNATSKSDQVCKMFVQLFKNLRSRTTEVEGVKIGSSKLTVGKGGFGTRWNVKADQVTAWDSSAIFEILDKAEEIAEWMKNNRMKDQADRLLRFAEKAKVFAQAERMSYKKDVSDKGILYISVYDETYNVVALRLDGDLLRVVCKKKNGEDDDEHTETVAEYTPYDSGDCYINLRSPYTYYVAREEFISMVEPFIERCNNIKATAEKDFAGLKEEFKRELTLLSI